MLTILTHHRRRRRIHDDEPAMIVTTALVRRQQRSCATYLSRSYRAKYIVGNGDIPTANENGTMLSIVSVHCRCESPHWWYYITLYIFLRLFPRFIPILQTQITRHFGRYLRCLPKPTTTRWPRWLSLLQNPTLLASILRQYKPSSCGSKKVGLFVCWQTSFEMVIPRRASIWRLPYLQGVARIWHC
jgi:hypothetical protein